MKLWSYGTKNIITLATIDRHIRKENNELQLLLFSAEWVSKPMNTKDRIATSQKISVLYLGMGYGAQAELKAIMINMVKIITTTKGLSSDRFRSVKQLLLNIIIHDRATTG